MKFQAGTVTKNFHYLDCTGYSTIHLGLNDNLGFLYINQIGQWIKFASLVKVAFEFNWLNFAMCRLFDFHLGNERSFGFSLNQNVQ